MRDLGISIAEGFGLFRLWALALPVLLLPTLATGQVTINPDGSVMIGAPASPPALRDLTAGNVTAGAVSATTLSSSGQINGTGVSAGTGNLTGAGVQVGGNISGSTITAAGTAKADALSLTGDNPIQGQALVQTLTALGQIVASGGLALNGGNLSITNGGNVTTSGQVSASSVSTTGGITAGGSVQANTVTGTTAVQVKGGNVDSVRIATCHDANGSCTATATCPGNQKVVSGLKFTMVASTDTAPYGLCSIYAGNCDTNVSSCAMTSFADSDCGSKAAWNRQAVIAMVVCE